MHYYVTSLNLPNKNFIVFSCIFSEIKEIDGCKKSEIEVSVDG